jgi:hypothetical protein
MIVSQRESPFVASAEWNVLCASAIGRSHRKQNTALQDYGMGVSSPFPFLIMADGAGSAANSRAGAETAVKAALDLIAPMEFRIDSRQKCLQLYERVLAGVTARAKEMEVGISSMASTLILVYVLHEKFFWMQLGDGVIVAQKSGVAGCVSIPFRGEFANETVFITSPGARDFLQHGVFPASDCDGIMAFTDGLGPAFIHEGRLEPAPICSSLVNN